MTRTYTPIVFAASAAVTAALLALLAHNAICVGVAALAGALFGYVLGAIFACSHRE